METGWRVVRACRDWSSATGASSAATGSDGTPFSRTTVINLFLTARKVKSQFQSPKIGKNLIKFAKFQYSDPMGSQKYRRSSS
jgi:hypothetical protein